MKKKHCPICKKSKVDAKNLYAPFCSQKCKEIDLGKWALERYRIAGEAAERQEEKEGEKDKNNVD